MELFKVDSLEQARQKLLRAVKDWMLPTETVNLESSLGRCLAVDLFSTFNIPAFRRSTVDGYAVIAKDTTAAGESIPVILSVKGKVEMGEAADFVLKSGECAEVPTGGMLPEGADAVVMVEYSEPFGRNKAVLYQSAANGENAVQIGEDVREGELLLKQGKRLLPQDIGALAAAGITRVPVYGRPTLTILSTGDELVIPDQKPLPGQIRDINTYALKTLAEKNGFEILHTAIIPDSEETLEHALLSAMQNSDIVAISGGSSQGEKDATRAVIERVSVPGVFTHGLALKPGKPTIIGYDEASRTLLAGLPGHPVSAMMVFELLFSWLLHEMTGSEMPPAVPARISCNLASSPGRLTCWPAKLKWMDFAYTAEPIFGKAGLITTLTKANGYFIVDRNREGLLEGEIVLVHLF